MSVIEALKKRVEEITDLKESVKALVHGLADELDTLTQDPVAIKRVAAELREKVDEVLTALFHNTKPEPKVRPALESEEEEPKHRPHAKHK